MLFLYGQGKKGKREREEEMRQYQDSETLINPSRLGFQLINVLSSG
jgi:hypothetical protein